MSEATISPIIDGREVTLDPAQKRLLADDSRVIAVNWHRQKGKDFTTAAKAVLDALTTGSTWYIVSLTQRQADETFDKCVKWANAYKAILETIVWATRQTDADLDEEFEFKARELRLPNGGRVVSLPGRDPNALAGFTGNIILTEFGLFPKGGYDHWRVIFPIITRGFRIIAISTPRGKNTKFFELCNDPDTYSVHKCDIHQSIDEGFVLKNPNTGEPCSIDEFKTLYGDDAGWKREYECEFTGDLEALVKWAQLQRASEAGRGKAFDLLRIEGDAGWRDDFFDKLCPARGRLNLGWDVARKGHLSSLWVNHVEGGVSSLRFLVLMHNVSFELQRRVIRQAMRTRLVACGCGDATGLGMDSNETLAGEFGQRWEPVDFGGKRKSDLGSGLATAFIDNDIAIPPLDGEHKFIAADIYAIQKEEQGAGNSRRLKFYETENPLMPASHCDIAWSAALSIRAGTLQGATPGIVFI